MVDTTRKTMHSEPPVPPGMYRSSYKRDYQWCEESPSEEDRQKLRIADSQLRAKEFAVPREEQATTYSNSVVGERREVAPALGFQASSHDEDAGGRKAEGSPSGPKALQLRSHFTPVLSAAESCLPKYYPATEPAATQAEKLERLEALAEPEDELSYCQHLPAAAQTAGTAGMLLHRQKLTPAWDTYQQFTWETCRATQHDARQNRSMGLGSSVLVEDYYDPDWRSTYNIDFQHWPGAHGGYRKRNKNLSHIFPEDEQLNQNYWVSEYEDNYSIFLQRLNRSSQNPAAGLCSGVSFGEGITTETAQ